MCPCKCISGLRGRFGYRAMNAWREDVKQKTVGKDTQRKEMIEQRNLNDRFSDGIALIHPLAR